MALPESVPHTQQRWWHGLPLMATSLLGGSPVVLVTEEDNWTRYWSRRTVKWNPWPEVVVDTDVMVLFVDDASGTRPPD
nr:unnamed protein product [Digitaria exilis]